MKMLVVGDSYATNYAEDAWPKIVEDYFNCKAENVARPASGLHYAYKELTNRLENTSYDVVIFVLTSADRPYHKNMIIHGGFPQYNDGSPVPIEIKRAIHSYYLYLHDTENSIISHDVMCRALTQISLEHKQTKFIFVSAFDNFKKVSNGNCVITEKRLIDFSMLDIKGHAAETRGEPVEKHNHLTSRQNRTLAKYIIDSIKKYQFGTVTFRNIDGLKKI